MKSAPMIVNVEVVVLAIHGHSVEALLLKRSIAQGMIEYALPGRRLTEDDGLEATALRALSEEIQTTRFYLEQLYTFCQPERDPRGCVVTVAYYAFVPPEASAVNAGSGAGWFPISRLPQLETDESRVIEDALERIRKKLEYTTIGFHLLPEQFSLPQLQRVYETILGKELDRHTFRDKIRELDVLTQVSGWKRTPTSAARLYSYTDMRSSRSSR